MPPLFEKSSRPQNQNKHKSKYLGMLKPFKVTDSESLVRKGIVVHSLADLRSKFAAKFKTAVRVQDLKVFLEDGTEVDDDEYLMSLPHQSMLIVSRQRHSGTALVLKSLLERWSTLFPTNQIENQVLLHQTLKEKMPELISVVRNSPKCGYSTKAEDPDWFRGCVGTCTTKEAYLFKRAQERVRGYLQKCKEQLQSAGTQTLLDAFKAQLKTDKFFGHYFNRAAPTSQRFCDAQGQFLCQGAYQTAQCPYLNGYDSHIINPYDNWESRVVFSTWNLDHVIERSRTVVPAIIEAVQNARGKTLNWRYFYTLLFTQHNLRLVHIVCHDKRSHGGQCDPSQFYLDGIMTQ